MNYGYPGVRLKNVIKNYKKIDGEIVVTYLNGKTSKMENTLENEKELLNTMLNQAKERKEYDEVLEKAKDQKSETFICELGTNVICFCGIIAGILIGNDIVNWNLENGITGELLASSYRARTSLIASMVGVDVLLNILITFGLVSDTKKVEELEKYNIYLDMYEDLGNVPLYNMFIGVKNKSPYLNINTLDNYSLKEIRRVRNNLLEYKENQSITRQLSR